jgi:hypothetical protein
MFVDLFEKSAKVLIPAFTQTMKEMAPYLPQMEKALLQIVKALAYFLKDLGPGMKDSATIWVAMGIAIKGIMIGLAATLNFLAHVFVWFGHQVNGVGKGAVVVWHAIAAAAKWAWHEISSAVSSLWHDIARIFGSIKTAVMHTWDSLWGGIKSTVSDAVGWIEAALGPLMSLFDKIGGFLSTFLGGNGGGAMPGLPGGRSTGGYVPGMGSPNVDSTLIRAAPGERVLSHNEISGVGGSRVVDAIFGNARASGFGSFAHGGWVGVGHMMHQVRDEIMYPGAFESGPRWAPSDRTLQSTHVTVNMGLVTDPQAVAREIQTMLVNLKRNRGGAPLGLA